MTMLLPTWAEPVARSSVDAPPPIVLAAHGSQDPRSAATIRRLAEAVSARWPAPVVASFLEFDRPSVAEALRRVARLGGSVGRPQSATDRALPVVVPLLLTRAYHGRVDLPGVLNDSGVPAHLSPVLGVAEPGEWPDPRLIAALRRRLSEVCLAGDGIVLLAAGTSWAPARSTVDTVAAALTRATGVACVVGYASGSAPDGAAAADALRAVGARRIVAASYFVAPGRLCDIAAASARAGGAAAVAAPIGDAAELVSLVLARATRAHSVGLG